MGKVIRRTPEQIIRMLRQAEVLCGQGKTIEMVCRELGISDATYYKWRKEYGGMGVDQYAFSFMLNLADIKLVTKDLVRLLYLHCRYIAALHGKVRMKQFILLLCDAFHT